MEKGVEIFEHCQEFNSEKARIVIDLSRELSSRTGTITEESWQRMLKIARETKELLGGESHKDALKIAERGYEASELARKGYFKWKDRNLILSEIKKVIDKSFEQPLIDTEKGDSRKARELAVKIGTGAASDENDWEWALEIAQKTAELEEEPEDYWMIVHFIEDSIKKEEEQIMTGGFHDEKKRLEEYKRGRGKELRLILGMYKEKAKMAEKKTETK